MIASKRKLDADPVRECVALPTKEVGARERGEGVGGFESEANEAGERGGGRGGGTVPLFDGPAIAFDLDAKGGSTRLDKSSNKLICFGPCCTFGFDDPEA